MTCRIMGERKGRIVRERPDGEGMKVNEPGS